ncbi:MAG: hypothetical protein ABI183_20155, partial [Polyangiaceae bacterium]
MNTPKPLHHESKPISQSLPFSPKVIVLFTGLALIFGSIIAVLVFHTPTPTRARIIGARLDLVSGDVAVTDQGTTSKELSGTPLAVGAHIATGKGARAMVRTADGAAVFLRDNTEIVLADK